MSIVRSDERRCFVVPSAPGKRFEGDTKITDLLYLCYELVRQNVDFSEPFDKISARYLDLSKALGVSIDTGELLAEVESRIAEGAGRDLCGVSRRVFVRAHFGRCFGRGVCRSPPEAILFRADGRLDGRFVFSFAGASFG